MMKIVSHMVKSLAKTSVANGWGQHRDVMFQLAMWGTEFTAEVNECMLLIANFRKQTVQVLK